MQQVHDFAREKGLHTFDEFMAYDVSTVRSYRKFMPDRLVYNNQLDADIAFGFALSFPEATQGFTRTVTGPERYAGVLGAKSRRQLKGLLRDAWGIHSSTDFEEAFTFLASGKDSSAGALMKQIAAAQPGDYPSVLMPDRIPESLQAWNSRRIATLAYLGCSLGIADINFVSDALRDAAQRARSEYASWREFNEAYHCGLVVHSSAGHVAWMNMLYMNYFKRQPDSPWQTLRF